MEDQEIRTPQIKQRPCTFAYQAAIGNVLADAKSNNSDLSLSSLWNRDAEDSR